MTPAQSRAAQRAAGASATVVDPHRRRFWTVAKCDAVTGRGSLWTLVGTMLDYRQPEAGVEMMKQNVECTIPILPVRSLLKSIVFFTETLGFQLDWGDASSTVCSVSRDGKPIMLRESAGELVTAWVWIGLEDDTLFREFEARGVEVLQPARNCAWAYEMKFRDIDGNVLWLGTEPKKGMPIDDA